MALQSTIEDKLTQGLTPVSLVVENESDKHAGHAGHSGSGDSHFRIHIVSEAFDGKSRLERHRLVNELLTDELAGPVHALAIHAKAPGE